MTAGSGRLLPAGLDELADLAVLVGVVLVVGRPGAGKTTLARALAACLGGMHVSLGDQLRRLRKAGRWTDADERAYAGQCAFQLPTLVEALMRGTAGATGGALVVDGSVGLRDAVLETGHMPVAEFQLDLDEETATARLRQRAAFGEREDDVTAIARGRADVWHRYWETASVPAWPVTVLPAHVPAPELVGQALSVLLVLSTGQAGDGAIPCPGAGDRFAAELAGLAEQARRTGQPHLARMGSENSIEETSSVLVIKPGLGQNADTFCRFDDWMNGAGYRAVAAAAWPLTAPGMVRRIAAHHGRHYVNSRWGNRTLTPIVGEPRRVVGYLQTPRGYRRSAWWSDATTRLRVQRGSYLWVDVEGHEAVVNSHVPGVIEKWFSEPNDVVIALIVVSDAGSLQARRSADLGGSDPGRAPSASLRGAAYEGRIPFVRRPTHEMNAFHVSDSAAAVELERQVWFSTI